MSGNYFWECTNKECEKHLVSWSEILHGGVVEEGGNYAHADENGNIRLCRECKKELDKYYTTCTECGCSTTGGLSVCANCYEK